MRMNKMFRLALASIVATGMASAAFADDDVRHSDTPDTMNDRPADSPTAHTDDDTDVRGDGLVPGSTGTATGTTMRNNGSTTMADTTMSPTSQTPAAFDMFDQRWCVGDGPTPVACDVRVIPPGPDAFAMFGETWCLNDAPGRVCDVRVRGDGIIDDDSDDEG